MQTKTPIMTDGHQVYLDDLIERARKLVPQLRQRVKEMDQLASSS